MSEAGSFAALADKNSLIVETWPIDRVTPYARNPRKNENAVVKVAASLKEFGWRQPIVVDSERVIIAGHTRLLAARQLGMESVPVHVATNLTPAQVKAYRLADNRTGEEAEWDSELLGLEFGDLSALDFDLSLTGFDPDEIAAAGTTSVTHEESEDVDLAPPKKPKSERGVVYQLGRHRVMCGDATDPEDVKALTCGAIADMCFTSPPYSKQREYGELIEDWDGLMLGVFGILPVSDAAQVLVNLGLVHDDGEWVPYWDTWIESMRKMGWRRFGWYVWDQGPGLPGDWNGRLAPSHEFVFHFNRVAERARKTKDCKHAGTSNHGSGLRKPDGSVSGYSHAGKEVQARKVADSVIRVMRHKGRGIEVEHPAVFPVGLVTEVLSSYSDEGDTAYEPFAGSGTTIIGAEQTNRTVLAMELSPAYCDVIRRRYAEFVNDPSLAP